MLTDTDKPRFVLKLDLHLSRLGEHVTVDDPTLIPDKMLDQAWQLMSDFVIDMLDELGEEVTDEEYRIRFLEVIYRLAYREMFMLNVAPQWEKVDIENLGTRRRGPPGPNRKKGPYDDTWHSH